jgi:NAD(P)H-dependent flavin oxidoreductase YrpB (nitropropane dioxygenase family)
MKIKPLYIGELTAQVPIIQGGMGIGISRSRLASAVANEGGIGIISGVAIGFMEPDFEKNPQEANLRALAAEIKKARELSPKGIIGVNFLTAMNNFDELVRTAVKEGADLIVAGAGIPGHLPELVNGYKTKIAPIVSSGRAAKIILKMWDKKYDRTADMVIVEGPEAGGHLGFSEEDLPEAKKIGLLKIVQDVIEEVKVYEEKYNVSIPVIAAGGIYSGADIAKYLKNGASGVQMATRFVATQECDADIKYKEQYINCKKEDIMIIKSPVGMPGRAVNNEFIKKISTSKPTGKSCYQCLKGCNPKIAPYCISRALIEAVKGNVDEGLIFVGSNAYKIDKIVSVKELISNLIAEAEEA